MKAIAVLREARASGERFYFHPGRVEPTGIVKTLDACGERYDCDVCLEKKQCIRLYETLSDPKLAAWREYDKRRRADEQAER